MVYKMDDDPKRPCEEAALALIRDFATAIPGDGEGYGTTAEEMIARAKRFLCVYGLDHP